MEFDIAKLEKIASACSKYEEENLDKFRFLLNFLEKLTRVYGFRYNENIKVVFFVQNNYQNFSKRTMKIARKCIRSWHFSGIWGEAKLSIVRNILRKLLKNSVILSEN